MGGMRIRQNVVSSTLLGKRSARRCEMIVKIQRALFTSDGEKRVLI